MEQEVGVPMGMLFTVIPIAVSLTSVIFGAPIGGVEACIWDAAGLAFVIAMVTYVHDRGIGAEMFFWVALLALWGLLFPSIASWITSTRY